MSDGIAHGGVPTRADEKAMTTPTERTALDQLVGSACRLVGARTDVGTITVVPGRRLTYDELARAREHAAAGNVRLTMDGHGVVRLRCLGAAEAAAAPEPVPDLRRPARPAVEGSRHGR